ncbi:hypothetical protein [Demequina salsinemoris]|uniref:hypothetical protein n=1 Tax=Demequina salsinemoris TaxID=577470 RepID=UPI0007825185|nr:hypothetical protein [Demequina salsinemoris]
MTRRAVAGLVLAVPLVVVACAAVDHEPSPTPLGVASPAFEVSAAFDSGPVAGPPQSAEPVECLLAGSELLGCLHTHWGRGFLRPGRV